MNLSDSLLANRVLPSRSLDLLGKQVFAGGNVKNKLEKVRIELFVKSDSDDVIIVDLEGRLVMGVGDELLRDVMNELVAEGWTKRSSKGVSRRILPFATLFSATPPAITSRGDRVR